MAPKGGPPYRSELLEAGPLGSDQVNEPLGLGLFRVQSA